MTGSDPNLVAIVVPIVAFFALAFWLGLCFYAGNHPSWRRYQPASERQLASPRQTGTLPPPDRPGLSDSAGRAPGVQRAAHR